MRIPQLNCVLATLFLFVLPVTVQDGMSYLRLRLTPCH